MPSVDHANKEVLLKIVYYGPGLGGKTTNLEQIHRRSKPENRGRLLSLASESERTLFFDLLPVELGTFKGYSIRLHLCTVPGQMHLDRTRQMILHHVDGVVFVVDSQPAAFDKNIESLANLADNLRMQEIEPERLPIVVQYNKRDLEGVSSIPALRRELDIPSGVPEVGAAAKRGQGVFETLKAIVSECLRLLGDPRHAPQGRSPSIMPGRRASMFPGARASRTRERPSHELILPKPPRVPHFGAFLSSRRKKS